MKSNQQRLNNITGQIEGVKKMLDEHKDCIKVLTQLKAIRSAVSGVMNKVIDTQFDTCMNSVSKKDKALLIKIRDYVKTN
jgi:CsoR family transcriptional regulator, copper-sensing transcriptional repressor